MGSVKLELKMFLNASSRLARSRTLNFFPVLGQVQLQSSFQTQPASCKATVKRLGG